MSACVVVASALAVCIVLGPGWLVGPDTGLTAAERLNAENDVRATLLQGLGGLLALGGVMFGAMATLRQVRANRERHSIELFTTAIEQLASDRMSVRHGGAYALEQLAVLDAGYRGHVHALLTAFVREHAPWPPVRPESALGADRARFTLGIADDVGGALGALGSRAMILDGAWSELERVDLRDAHLDGFAIPRICFAHSNLSGASLVGAKLAGASLQDTLLRNVNLSEADLRGANLARADLDGATLRGADLTDANLDGAQLTGVIADSTTTWPTGFSAAIQSPRQP
jgi:hypothetical protein